MEFGIPISGFYGIWEMHVSPPLTPLEFQRQALPVLIHQRYAALNGGL
jgi:hypothetical protein